jgi:cell division septation protein DedD
MSSSRERGKTVSKEEKKGKGKKKATLTTGASKYLGYGLVATFLLVWVFVLGTLTGRGDMNRLFQRLGLYKTNLAARLGMDPDRQATPVLPAAPVTTSKALADAEKKPGPETEAAAKASATAPAAQTATVASAIPAAEAGKKNGTQEAKKAKTAAQKHEREHEHDRSLASKLSFQNSLDTPTKKKSKTPAKKEPAVHTASIAPAPVHTPAEHSVDEKKKAEEKKKTACVYQVRVATYHSAAEAEKTLAELKKKGINISLQKGKDKTGQTFVLKTGKYSNKAEAEKVTKKLKEAKLNGQIQELKQ